MFSKLKCFCIDLGFFNGARSDLEDSLYRPVRLNFDGYFWMATFDLL